MQYNLPKAILNDKDLKYYENYLSEDTMNHTEIIENRTFENLLKRQIGKFAKIEVCPQNKIGVIIEVGKDYLIISNSNNNTIIQFCNIKSVILFSGKGR